VAGGKWEGIEGREELEFGLLIQSTKCIGKEGRKQFRSKNGPQGHTHPRMSEGGREGGEDKEGRRETYRGSRNRSGGGLGLGGTSTLASRLRGFLASRLDNRLLGSRGFFRRSLLARRASSLGRGSFLL